MKRLVCFMLAMLMLFAVVPAAAAQEGKEVTVLFTHDMHSHIMSTIDETGASFGGYARLKTVIDEQKAKYPDALLVDGGDFSMGSLFQTVYATDAVELRIMGAMGYDATTFGNHEYDYRAAGLADMLNAAVDSGEPLPMILEANYLPPAQGEEGYNEDAEAVWQAFARYGVEREYAVIRRGGVNFALFGLLGVDSDECAPLSGMVHHDAAETARRIVEKIEAEVAEPCVVICLSHSGTTADPGKSEDEQLAKAVKGIDVIVSGHTHSKLEKPIQVNGTYIVSALEYGKYLGKLRLKESAEGWSLLDYELIPINAAVAEDAAIAARIEEYAELVSENYLSTFGDLAFDTVLAYNPYTLESLADLNIHKETGLGNLIADAYKWAVESDEAWDGVPVDFALTASGVVRDALPTGEVTVESVFDILSLGIGADGIPGYPLASVYITGRDLKNAFEVDASITGIMPSAQLYFTGMTFTYNPNRMLFNKVTDCAQVLADGTTVPIEDDRLYRVVTGLYCGQMLGTVNKKSFGILSVVPRDAQGNEITDLEAYIVHNAQGEEIKEWYALASYLQMLGTVPADYSHALGRKVSEPSWNPVDLLKNANWITLVVLAVLILLILALVLIVRKIVRRRRRKKA